MEPSSEPAGRTFQERLEELTRLVEELEKGELPLEDAIDHFEQGERLHRSLLQDLEAFERRVEKLVRGRDGEDRLEPTTDGPGREGDG